MDCQLLEGRPGGHSTHLLVVGCGNENISWGLLPRKEGGPGQSCWLTPRVLERGRQKEVPLVPQQLLSLIPCLPLSTHKGDKPLPSDTLPGNSHFVPFTIPTHGTLIQAVFLQHGTLPRPKAGLEFQGEGGAGEVTAVKQMGTRTDE